MTKRIVVLLTLLAVMMGLVSAVSAQDAGCFNLSADDCAIINAASANTAENANSFVQTYTIDFSVSGLAMMGMGDITFTLEGSGPFVFFPDAAADALPFAMDQTMNVAFNDGTTDGAATIRFVIVDNVLYAQDPTTEAWVGVNLIDLMNSPEIAGSLPVNPADLMGGDMSALGDPAALLGGLGPDEMAAIDAMVNTPGFLNYERLADEEGMGQALYPFSFTADFAPLFASEIFGAFMEGFTGGLTEADPSTAQMAMLLPILLENSTAVVNVTQWVGANDNFIHKLSFTVASDIDLSALMGASGTGTEMEPISINLVFTVDLTDLNAAPTVVAPEGAEMVPLEDLMGSMGQ